MPNSGCFQSPDHPPDQTIADHTKSQANRNPSHHDKRSMSARGQRPPDRACKPGYMGPPRFTPANAPGKNQRKSVSSPDSYDPEDDGNETPARSGGDETPDESDDTRMEDSPNQNDEGRGRSCTRKQTYRDVFYECPFAQQRPGFTRCTDLEGGRKTKQAVWSLPDNTLTLDNAPSSGG